jgi:hypothetical protein
VIIPVDQQLYLYGKHKRAKRWDIGTLINHCSGDFFVTPSEIENYKDFHCWLTLHVAVLAVLAKQIIDRQE